MSVFSNTRREFLRLAGFGAAALAIPRVLRADKASSKMRPNIVFIMADDMGIGDVGCYNKESLIPTPNMDRLAAEGVRFTDAHSPSAVCTPTRYGLLTGRYCWRTPLKSEVLFNYEPPLIEPTRLTVASLLKKQGYRTACIGKWHLGLRWGVKQGQKVDFARRLPWPGGSPEEKLEAKIDFSKPVTGGPNDLGFDYAFYTSGCATAQPPYCFIDNGRCIGMAKAKRIRPEGRPRAGMTAEGWNQREPDLVFTGKAVEFMEKHRKDTPDKPLFLYLPLSSPHAPWVPPKLAQGRSREGPRGDLVCVVDWSVGRILEALERLKIADDTLVVVTSDNGPRIGARGHKSAGQWRGYKSHIWEGGHREPFLARWPGKIKPGATCAEPIELTDVLATFAALTAAKVPKGAGEDSYNVLPALLDGPSAGPRAGKPIREALVHHSCFGVFSIRRGDWKLILETKSSGGWVKPRGTAPAKGSPGQLYNIAGDPYETSDLWDKHPEIVERLTKLLEKYKKDGRSAPARSL